MKSDEKTLIDGLFSRLREAEGQSAPRDAEAEAQINQHLVRQPAAPYYSLPIPSRRPSASPIATIPPTAVSPMAISAIATSTTTPASSATTICSPDR